MGLRGSDQFNQLGILKEDKFAYFNRKENYHKQNTGENDVTISYNDLNNNDFDSSTFLNHINPELENNFFDDLINYKHLLDDSIDYKYIDVACEANRTYLLVKFNKKNYNELYVIGDKNNFLDDVEVGFFGKGDTHIIKLNLKFEKLKIKSIYAKKNTTLFVTEDNSIYIKGSTFCNFDDIKFKLISKKFPKDISSIEFGNEHILLLTSNMIKIKLITNVL